MVDDFELVENPVRLKRRPTVTAVLYCGSGRYRAVNGVSDAGEKAVEQEANVVLLYPTVWDGARASVTVSGGSVLFSRPQIGRGYPLNLSISIELICCDIIFSYLLILPDFFAVDQDNMELF